MSDFDVELVREEFETFMKGASNYKPSAMERTHSGEYVATHVEAAWLGLVL